MALNFVSADIFIILDYWQDETHIDKVEF